MKREKLLSVMSAKTVVADLVVTSKEKGGKISKAINQKAIIMSSVSLVIKQGCQLILS